MMNLTVPSSPVGVRRDAASAPAVLQEERQDARARATTHSSTFEHWQDTSTTDPTASRVSHYGSGGGSKHPGRSTGLAAFRKSVTKRLSRHHHGVIGLHGIEEEGTGSRHFAPRISVLRRKYQNQNMPTDYGWMSELLELILKNETAGIGSLDGSTRNAQVTSPLFVVCGACPSSWAPMQAVLFSAVGSGVSNIDFWWIKPVKGQTNLLEKNTLHRCSKGPHKNDPGRSKPIYKPIGDLFVGNGNSKVKQDFQFGMEMILSTQRAFIEDPRGSGNPPPRYYIYLVWQEEWTQNLLSSNKFIKGKIAYQRDPLRGLEALIFLREYCISNGKMDLADHEEPMPRNTVLPSAVLKDLCLLKGHGH
jgi:hypothetical protein